MIYRTYYLSPLGKMLLAADDIWLVGAWFEGQKYFGEFPGHRDFVFEEKEYTKMVPETLCYEFLAPVFID